MNRHLCALVAASALVAAAAPSQAQDAVAQDMRCVAAFAMATGQTADPEKQGPLIAATMYFIGRLDGRAPGIDLEARLKAEVVRMAASGDVATDGKRCGELVGARGKDLMEIGQRLQAEAAKTR